MHIRGATARAAVGSTFDSWVRCEGTPTREGAPPDCVVEGDLDGRERRVEARFVLLPRVQRTLSKLALERTRNVPQGLQVQRVRVINDGQEAPGVQPRTDLDEGEAFRRRQRDGRTGSPTSRAWLR